MGRLLIVIFMLVQASAIHGKEKGGLILSGLDTLSTKNQKGFDFVTQTCCTTSINTAPYACVDHFLINVYLSVNNYLLSLWPDNQNGPAYCINMGKMNFDSIKAAPADSIFTKQPNGHGDDIPVDSISSRIGNLYLMKTATDPRPIYDNPFYAKVRILKFVVLDSAQHQIKMVFLWAYNLSGLPDLTTSGLDTFHLDGTTLNQPNNRLANSMNRANAGQCVFKVVGDRFVLPQELVGKVKWLTVWDLRGKRVARIEVGNSNSNLELPKDLKGKGIFVVKLER
jgi:hypothetical protein